MTLEQKGFDRIDDNDTPVSSTPNRVETLRLEEIQTNSITGPLVVFYGPREIGKTVALWRLVSYVSGHFNVTPNKIFRKDPNYSDTVTRFKTALSDASRIAPDATGNINFLLLDVVNNHSMNSVCQVLEAPGEHFFDSEKPEATYPKYLEDIFAAPYKKVYVFFFAIGMFKDDETMRKYSEKIVDFINTRMITQRDRIIIVCNKCDQQPWIKDGMPIWAEYQKNLLESPPLSRLKKTITDARFPQGVSFVPFMSGRFQDIEGSEKRLVTPSPDYYPATFWEEIYKSIYDMRTTKEGWFAFLLRLIGIKS